MKLVVNVEVRPALTIFGILVLVLGAFEQRFTGRGMLPVFFQVVGEFVERIKKVTVIEGRRMLQPKAVVQGFDDGIRHGDFVAGDPKLATLALLGACTWVHRWFNPGGRLTEAAIANDFAERAVRMLQP